LEMEQLSELEARIDNLLGTLHTVRQENESLKEQLNQKDAQLGEQLTGKDEEINRLNEEANHHRHKLDEAANRIGSLISKLESVG